MKNKCNDGGVMYFIIKYMWTLIIRAIVIGAIDKCYMDKRNYENTININMEKK